MTPGSIRIPFSLAVDCGFGGNCFARNISKTGVYIEAPQHPKATELVRGLTIRMLIAPFGSAPSATLEGNITRIENIKLSDGSDGLGLGIQFKKMPDELQAVLQRHISRYIEETISADDPRLLGRTLFEQAATNSLPPDESLGSVRSLLAQLPPIAKTRIKNVLAKSYETSADWHLGQGYLMEIGLEAVLAKAISGEKTDRTPILERIKIHIGAFQHELQGDSAVLDISDHAVRKEVAEMSSRLSSILKRANTALDSDSQPTEPPSAPASDAYVGVFFDTEFFESFLGGKMSTDILEPSDQNLIQAIAQDWDKTVRERSKMPENITALMKRARVLAIKIGFEARRLFRSRPLAKNLPQILPHLRLTSTQFLDVQKQIKILLDGSPTETQKEPLASVGRASSYLGSLVAELQRFVSALPVTPEAATAFYKEPRLRPIVYDPKKAYQKRHSGMAVSIPKPLLFGLLLVSIGAFFYSNMNLFWGIFYQFKTDGVGPELGIRTFSINNDTFEGIVSEDVWRALSSEDQQRLGEAFANKWVQREIPRVILMTPRGQLLGKTMNFNGRRVWMVATTLREPTVTPPAPTPTITASPTPEPSQTPSL